MSENVAPSELSDSHEHSKKFLYLYICKKCIRSFESQTATDKCKFCDGDVKLIDNRQLYTFVCPGCYKKFTAKKAEKCPRCGSKFLHFTKAEKVTARDLLSKRKRHIFTKLKNLLQKKS